MFSCHSNPVDEPEEEIIIEFFNESDFELLEIFINLIPAHITDEFNTKYFEWVETWKHVIAGDPYSYAESKEYFNLIDYCLQYDKALWPLVIDITLHKEYYRSLNLLKDLTFGGSMEFVSHMLKTGIPNCYEINLQIKVYCKKLFDDEKYNILKCISEIK